MSSLDPYTKGSKAPRKKYLYQYSFDGESQEYVFEGEDKHFDFINEYEKEFEQPKGRRQARKQGSSKRKRLTDFY